MLSYCNKSPPNIRGSTQCLFLAWASPLHLSGCLHAASGLGGGGGGALPFVPSLQYEDKELPFNSSVARWS